MGCSCVCCVWRVIVAGGWLRAVFQPSSQFSILRDLCRLLGKRFCVRQAENLIARFGARRIRCGALFLSLPLPLRWVCDKRYLHERGQMLAWSTT